MSPDAYAALVASLQEHGYIFTGFSEPENSRGNDSRAILRHDVDFSLVLAGRLAAWEAQRGVAAHYFIQIASPLYNAMSAESRRIMAEISAGGHAIGLHFDSSSYEQVSAYHVEQELETLASLMSERPLETVSLHRPGMGLEEIRQWSTSLGFKTTYDAPWTTDYLYCSDSRGIWKYGNFSDVGRRFGGKSLQLLIHPLWWLMKGSTPSNQLRNFSAAAVEVTRRHLRETAVSFDF